MELLCAVWSLLSETPWGYNVICSGGGTEGVSGFQESVCRISSILANYFGGHEFQGWEPPESS